MVILASLLLISAASVGSVPGDTTVVLGSRNLDVTGDGEPELLQVIGTGESLDSLAVTFSITSSGRVLYGESLRPMTRSVGFDAGKRKLSPAEHHQRLADFESFFFAEEKFMSAEEFVDKLSDGMAGHIGRIPDVIARDGGGERAAGIWDEIQHRGVVVFEFSGGGDGVAAIAWSEDDQRFYRLWECC